jgi:hypothetical protein
MCWPASASRHKHPRPIVTRSDRTFYFNASFVLDLPAFGPCYRLAPATAQRRGLRSGHLRLKAPFFSFATNNPATNLAASGIGRDSPQPHAHSR